MTPAEVSRNASRFTCLFLRSPAIQPTANNQRTRKIQVHCHAGSAVASLCRALRFQVRGWLVIPARSGEPFREVAVFYYTRGKSAPASAKHA